MAKGFSYFYFLFSHFFPFLFHFVLPPPHPPTGNIHHMSDCRTSLVVHPIPWQPLLHLPNSTNCSSKINSSLIFFKSINKSI
ncbi:hypothetical protein GLYMA_12G186650v4 [Glycine max]|nr:hypothetical protein GLYMA_12G186650v4 [Glycine max]KAH1143858.1 hypothetical protein GYH30_034194 [Glycine max]